MSDRRSTLKCPKCGTEMNHHADRLVYPAGSDDEKQIDPVFGALVQETHGCPKCGNVEFRLADAS